MRRNRHRAVIVGCGHMGFAIARGLLEAPSWEVVAVETDSERRALLSQTPGLTVSSTLTLQDDDTVVLAIPPQLFPKFAEKSRQQFVASGPVISVMAGLKAASIAEALGTLQVVRSIPNTPSEVFEGMTVFYAAPGVSHESVRRAEQLLEAIGQVMRVEQEDLIDEATAICGGGPAFISYIADAFCQFAASSGFTTTQARNMAIQVLRGTSALIESSGKPPMQLCQEVMTPNGTTERGIAAFEAVSLKGSIQEALQASAARSRELAQVMSADAVVGAADD